MTTTRLILIRHSESVANAEGRLQGHLDFALSELGRRQSELLAERIAAERIDALYSSPLLRAKETADIIAARLSLEVRAIAELRERNLGALAGLTADDISERFPDVIRARREARAITVAGYEPDAELHERVSRAFGQIVAAQDGQAVAVVTHGGVIGAYLRLTLGLVPVRPGRFVLDNASITRFDIAHGEPPSAQLVLLNDACHLDSLAGAVP